MGTLRVFLDANILFSAALGGGSFQILWELARADTLELLSSPYCTVEARENLFRKRPEAMDRFAALLTQVRLVPEASDPPGWTSELLPEKDLPVLAAALAARANLLVTGDLRDFGPLMDRSDLPLRVCTLRTLLLEVDPLPPST